MALAGCGMAGGGAPQAATPGAATQAAEARQDAGAGTRGADPQAAPRPQMPPDDDPARLVGLLADAVTGRLGEPAMVRRDGHAQIWHYRATPGGGACVLHLFLYPERDTARVTHVEARAGTDLLAGDASRACLRAVLAGRATS